MTHTPRKQSSRAEKRRRERKARKSSGANSNTALDEARKLHELGRLEDAERGYRAILRAQPRHADAHHLLGIALLQSGRVEQARPCLEKAAELSPGNADIVNNLGEARRLQGDLVGAEAAYREALAANPNRAGTLNNLAIVLKSNGLYRQAEAALRRSVHLEPNDIGAALNLADLLATVQRFDEALAQYDSILVRASGVAAAHFGRAYALYVLDRLVEAEKAAREAVKLNADHDESVALLARVLVARSRYDEASEAFMNPVRRNFGVAAPNVTAVQRRRLFRTNRIKLRHDLEQLRYLIATGEYPPLLTELADDYEFALASVQDSANSEFFEADQFERALLTRYHNRLVNEWYPATLPQGALNPELKTHDIEEQFLDSAEGFVFFDDFLRPEALAAMQRFALVGSCWFKTDARAEVGASPDTGFCAPLLMQIAGETRLRFPRLLGAYYFNTLWGLKFYESQPGLGQHIDDAAMSINFWLTPDSANLNPSTGGLLYWNKEIVDPAFFDLEMSEKAKLMAEITALPDTKLSKVPYACNRAMLFRSTVLHGTDRVEFKESFAERRMNITCLYGRSESRHVS